MVAFARVIRPGGGRLFTRYLCRTILLTLIGSPAVAIESRFELTLPSGQDIELLHIQGSGKSTVIWIPSERGIQPRALIHAHKLSLAGHEVWVPDLHDAYFLTRNSDSLNEVPLDDLVALIDAAVNRSEAPVLLLSSLRGAQLALIAAREWQLKRAGQTRLNGIVLLHPNLYAQRPQAGHSARYLPIVRATNLPVYVLETQYSTRSLHLKSLADELSTGGSQVYTQVLPDVRGGFFVRDESELNAASIAAAEKFAATLDRALSLLTSMNTPAQAARNTGDTRQRSRIGARQTVLQEVTQPIAAPPIRLPRYPGDDETVLPAGRRATLINFWASWCGPCVEEIPSLHRLQAEMRDEPLDIVTVNIGENRRVISEFLEQVPMQLPVLMDVTGETAKRWNIYVYPSTYLVDSGGVIRYAYLGALEWDSPQNLRLMRDFLRGE